MEMAKTLSSSSTLQPKMTATMAMELLQLQEMTAREFFIASSIIMLIILWLKVVPSRRPRVYLVDLCCYKPTPKTLYQCHVNKMLRKAKATGFFTDDCLDFQRRILERAAISEESYGPPALMREPPEITMAGSREEAELVIFGALDDLFAKTGISASDVDVVIANCSLFGPLPSLSAMIVNHYGMRADVRTFNLSGMGCSAGAISTDLARRVLRGNPNKTKYAVVVSTENITQFGYTGNVREKLIPNCLFRMGAAAILYTNRPEFKSRSKYEVVHTVRTHLGASDMAYNSVFMDEDEEGKVGVTLPKDLSTLAAQLMTTHLFALGPLVLPICEQLLYAIDFVKRKSGSIPPHTIPYIPKFNSTFQHFCVHAGGRALLDGMQVYLKLSKKQIEASRMTLYRFGNTSSSSPMYELAYCEAKGAICKGDRVWQLTFGSGFKCNSVVLVALKNIPNREKYNVWSDILDDLPNDPPYIQSTLLENAI